jgi:ABC-2 type transport system ATP-binding protein
MPVCFTLWQDDSTLGERQMIKIQDLTKTFGPKTAVNGISFTVERGEVLGFLGPNGAGKSTTMRMVTGFIPPTSGRIQTGEFDMLAQPIQAKGLIGYLPENAPLYSDMTVSGFLGFTAETRGLRGAEKQKAVNRAIELCFLEKVVHQSIDTLSKGYRHRACFAQAIIHDPPILIMDEPTDGLDPNQKFEMRSLIRRMGEKKTIIFSTHILEEVDAACTRAIVIDRGNIVANGTPSELKQKAEGAGAVLVRVAGLAASALQQALSPMAAVRKVVVVEETPGGVCARIFPQAKGHGAPLSKAIYELAVKSAWQLEELHTEEGRMDEVFRAITLSDTAKEGRQ